MFNNKAENKINVFKLQYYSLKSKPRPLGVLLVLVFCIFHALSTVSKLTELSQSAQGGKTQKQTATEDNAWQETQHLVSIIFRLTRVVSQITVQSVKMAVIPKVLLQHVHYCGEQRQKTQYHPNIGGPDCESLCNFEENDF